jgi:hypothetical protein
VDAPIRKVFVSFATEDREQAYALVDHLESRGLTCWIAPRNIPEGTPYATAIVDGIRSSNAILVVLSSASAASPHVLRELDSAVAAARPILTVQLDGARPSDALAYYLATTQWIPAGAGDWPRDGDRVLSALGRATETPPAFRARLSAAARAAWANVHARGLVVSACVLTTLSTLALRVSDDYWMDEYLSVIQNRSLILLMMAVWFAVGVLGITLWESIRGPSFSFRQRTANRYVVPCLMLIAGAGLWTALTDDSPTWLFRWREGPFLLTRMYPPDSSYGGFWSAAPLMVSWYFGALLLLLYQVPRVRASYRHAMVAVASVLPFLIPNDYKPIVWWWPATYVSALVFFTTVVRVRAKIGFEFAESASRGLIAGGSVTLLAIMMLMSVFELGRTGVYVQNRVLILLIIGLGFALGRGIERATIAFVPRRFRWRRTLGVFIASGCLAFAVAELWYVATGYWHGWITFVSDRHLGPFRSIYLSSFDIYGLKRLYDLDWNNLALDAATLVVISLYLAAWLFFVHGLLPERSILRRVAIVLGSLTPFLIPGVAGLGGENYVKLGVYAAEGATAVAVATLMMARPKVSVALSAASSGREVTGSPPIVTTLPRAQ